MPSIPPQSIAFPALWLFLLGLVLTLGVFRMRRARLDVRDDWNRLIRFHDAIKRVEGSRGEDGMARAELVALARALDDAVEAPEGRPGLAAVSARFDEAAAAGGVSASDAYRWGEELRRDVVAYDRAIQARMKESARDSGRFGRVFLAGAGGLLLLPLDTASRLGLVRRLTARHVEASLWFHAAVGIVIFIALAGTLYAAIAITKVMAKLLEA